MIELRENPVHISLHERKMFGGIPKRIAIAIWISSGQIAFVYGFWQLMLAALVAHAILRYLFKDDPFALEIYNNYTREADYYDPWPNITQKVNLRPLGFSRGTLC